MLTDDEILNAINDAPLAQGPSSFVLAVGRSIERTLLGKQEELLRQCHLSGQMSAAQSVTHFGATRRDWNRPGYDTAHAAPHGVQELLQEAVRRMEQFGPPDVQAHRLVSRALELLKGAAGVNPSDGSRHG